MSCLVHGDWRHLKVGLYIRVKYSKQFMKKDNFVSLSCNKDINGFKFGVEFLAYNLLLHTKSGQLIFNTINLYKSVKNRVFNKEYTFAICVGCVWIVIGYFLFEKQDFYGLSKVLDIQISL